MHFSFHINIAFAAVLSTATSFALITGEDWTPSQPRIAFSSGVAAYDAAHNLAIWKCLKILKMARSLPVLGGNSSGPGIPLTQWSLPRACSIQDFPRNLLKRALKEMLNSEKSGFKMSVATLGNGQTFRMPSSECEEPGHCI